MRLLECVPNFSEGRRPEVVQEIADAITGVAGAHLLDRSSDPDHHRSVLTFVAEPDDAVEAAFRATRAAAARIDLAGHRGVHPRMGAADVVPFVPVGDATMADAVAAARTAARRIGEELEIPTYLYGEAALREERRKLSKIRRSGLEALARSIGQDPAFDPDFGPRRLHPTAGATAVGARFFLIAFNVRLATDDIEMARVVASVIREKGGELPGVEALGFPLASRGSVQVSMNLFDYRLTSIGRAFQRVSERARSMGVRIEGAEIVGLVPRAAVERGLAEAIGIDGGIPLLEDRLTAARIDMSVAGWTTAIASTHPSPGGGAAAAITGALAAALVAKAAGIGGSRASEAARPDLQRIATEARDLADHLHAAAPRDTAAFERVAAAWRIPRADPRRRAAVEAAEKEAASEAARIADLARRVADLAGVATPLVSRHLAKDLEVARQLATAAQAGAGLLAAP